MKTILSALFFFAASQAAPGMRADGKLDMSSIQVDFREGELDVVKNLLESFLKNQGSTANRDEKIFAYKYLGVIYAANPDTRKKAESYFNQLLPLAPNIELADMYVSKEIQTIFDDVKRDYLHTQDYRKNFDSFGNPKTPEKTADKPKVGATKAQPGSADSEPSRKWVWWTAGLAGAAVATGVVIWMVQSDSPSSKHFDGGVR